MLTFSSTSCRNDKEKKPVKVHPEASVAEEEAPKKGVPFDKKPFPMELEAGKKYSWCVCGRSNKQPFCDGTHSRHKGEVPIERITGIFKPHRFEVTETKKYWLCMCKQTNTRPFCDGSHKSDFVQDKIKS